MPAASVSRRALSVGLAGYCAILAVVLLAPTSSDQSRMAHHLVELGLRLGLDPMTATQARAEFLGNALILMPVSALGSLLWPRTTWRDWTAIAFVAATAAELTQGFLLPLRTPSYVDIVANALGGLGGALVVGCLVAAWRYLAPREGRQELHR